MSEMMRVHCHDHSRQVHREGTYAHRESNSAVHEGSSRRIQPMECMPSTPWPWRGHHHVLGDSRGVNEKKTESTSFLWETELTTSPPEQTGILRKILIELSAFYRPIFGSVGVRVILLELIEQEGERLSSERTSSQDFAQ